MGTFTDHNRAGVERVLSALTEKSAELLRTRILVTDDRGVVVAGSDPAVVGLRSESLDDGADTYLRVPLRLDAYEGEVLVAAPPDGEVVPPRLAQALVELVVNQVAVLDRLPNQPELKSRFIHDLLHGAIGDEVTILREAKLLGLDLGPPRAVVLVDAGDYVLRASEAVPVDARDAEIRRRSQLVIGSIVGFFRLPTDTICAYIGEGEIAVMKASSTRDLATWVEQEPDRPGPSWANLAALNRAADALLSRLRADTGATITIGIGRYHPGIGGLADSYRDAQAALLLGRRFHGHNKVHRLDRLGIAAFVGVADERTKVDLATYLLSPLDHEPELLATLDAFFRTDCCPSAAAGQLAIHRNTLGYRLDKIASLTGLDPRRFDDAVQIRLALVLRALRSEAA